MYEFGVRNLIQISEVALATCTSPQFSDIVSFVSKVISQSSGVSLMSKIGVSLMQGLIFVKR